MTKYHVKVTWIATLIKEIEVDLTPQGVSEEIYKEKPMKELEFTNKDITEFNQLEIQDITTLSELIQK